MTDAEKYTALLLRHRTTIWRLCSRFARTDDTQRVADLVQEVSLALWEHFVSLRPGADEHAERLWVFFRSRDVLRTLRRHQRRQPQLVHLPDSLAETLVDDSQDLRQQLEDILDRLNDDDRRLIQQLHDGYNATEIAHALGITPNAVYQRTYRIIKKLKTINHAE